MMSSQKSTANKNNKRKKKTASARAQKKSKDLFDDPKELLESSSSPIYQEDINIKSILQHPLAVTTLGESEMGYQFASTTAQELATKAAQFKEDGKGGFYDIDWLREAQVASSDRANGVYDDYLKKKFAEVWADDEDLSCGEENVAEHKQETLG